MSVDAARHRAGARKRLGGLLWTFFWKLKWQYFSLLLSDYGREILTRKYDAIATDRAYELRPSGMLGPVGRAVDALVLGFPLHVALRQRLRLVIDTLKAEARRRAEAGAAEVAILSAPCGLARDVIAAASELRAGAPDVAARLRLVGLDLDQTGEVLPLAAERSTAANVAITLHRADLFDQDALDGALGGTPFHVVNSIGLTAWLDLPEVERLARALCARLVPGGALVVDNWAQHAHSHLGGDLEINTRYHEPTAFAAALERSGFTVESATPTGNRIATVYLARRSA